MQIDFLYCRLKFTVSVLELIHKANDGLQTDLITHALDTVKVQRRFRMLSQLGIYQQQIFAKIPNWHIESADDLQWCLGQVQKEIDVIINQSS